MYKNFFINKLYIKIKGEVCQSVFNSSSMDTHVVGQTLFANHRDQLISIIINTYVICNIKIKKYSKKHRKHKNWY